jgi:hypothetical protein
VGSLSKLNSLIGYLSVGLRNILYGFCTRPEVAAPMEYARAFGSQRKAICFSNNEMLQILCWLLIDSPHASDQGLHAEPWLPRESWGRAISSSPDHLPLHSPLDRGFFACGQPLVPGPQNDAAAAAQR